MHTKTWSNPGSTRFYKFRSHAPVSRALCRLVTSVIAKMAYQDSLLVAMLFTFLRLQRRRALQACYLGNCKNGVPRQSVGSDAFHLSAATAKVRTAAQYSSVTGDSQRKACGTFSLKTKAKADVFPSSDFELFCKGDFSSTNDLGEAKESYFLVAIYSSAPLLRAGSPFPPTHL